MSYLNIISKRYDKHLLALIFALCGLGTVMLYSASISESLRDSNGLTNTIYLQSHLKKLGIGLIAMLLLIIYDYRKLKPLSPYIISISIGLLILTKITYLLKGSDSAARWLDIGLISVQTSDIARLSLILYIAYYIDKKREKIKNFYNGLMPPIILISLLVLTILFQPDFSTAAIIGLIGFIMLFIGGAKISHLVSIGAIGITALIPLLLMKSYRFNRVMYWLSGLFNTEKTANFESQGHQMQHSLMSLSNGGLFGLGPGNSMHKNLFLPEPHNDFIFAIIGEELGLIGAIIVLTIFLLIFQRSIKIAKETTDLFGLMLTIGISISIVIYAFINAAVVTGIFPVTGLPIPLISHGGSNLIINMASLGILLNISKSKKSVNSFNIWKIN